MTRCELCKLNNKDEQYGSKAAFTTVLERNTILMRKPIIE